MLLIHLYPKQFHQCGGVYSFSGLAVTQSLCLPYMVARGLLFPGSVPPADMVDSKSVVSVKPGDSGVKIGYQIEFTHTWSSECFTVQSHIYSCFTGKMSTLTHFPFEPGCEDYSFWSRQLRTSKWS